VALRSRRTLLRALALAPLTLLLTARAAGRDPQVVAVPSRPAFVQLPGRSERQAVVGQSLLPDTVLRTRSPGRLQVRLADGRSFRLGGDAQLRLDRDALALQRGQLIAWVNPGSKGQGLLRVRTRVATASIEGTTVFLEVGDSEVKLFSWEGRVRVSTNTGKGFLLEGGQELVFRDGTWQPPRRLSREEARTRLSRSLLLNDFPARMETLPLIRRTLGLGPHTEAAPAP
jgi:ferric-dicitrate binding protein FerR (iron transport regulator)